MSDGIRIPTELLPADGRFGAGPSKVRQAQVDALAGSGRPTWGRRTVKRPSNPKLVDCGRG